MKLSKAKTLANKLLDKWNLSPRWAFEFDRAKRRFGCCKISKRKITISRHLTKRNKEAKVKDTILHEIAHALDFEDRGTSDHSEHWKRWARKVGANDSRCYDSSKVNSVDHKYYDYCPNCGSKNGRHKRRSKNKLLASCGKCSPGRGFDDDYMMIFNIPAKQMEQIENNELQWQELNQAQTIISKMHMTYPEGALENSKFYNDFHNFIKNHTRKAAAHNPKKKQKQQSKSSDPIALLSALIEKGEFTRQQIINNADNRLELSKSTIRTYITDGKNPKYNRFEKLVVENNDGTLSFQDD